MPLTIKQCRYTGPYASTNTKYPSKGPTVIALKRALARLGLMEWKGTQFTDEWPAGQALDQAFRTWQLSKYLPSDGIYGQQAWKVMRYQKVMDGTHKGDWAFDAYALNLINDEWAEGQVPDEEDVRLKIVDFCRVAESNEDAWHYRQARPVDVSVDPAASYVWSDCSGYVIQAYHYAKRKTGVLVPDPAIQGWTGYGNTDWYEDDHPKVSDGRFKVGDLAHYNGHVTLCRKAGGEVTAIWSSHGQEAGPQPVSLHYRPDLRFVVRPPLK
jgi:hypothetical protein